LSNLDFNNKEQIINAMNETLEFITSKINYKPEIAIVLGSGLGNLVEKVENPTIIPYTEIPNFPKPTVEGHGGNLYMGELGGKKVLLMQGRNHYYEGYDTPTITFPIRVFAKMGIKNIILTNACGSCTKHLVPGDLMLIEDHISFLCPSPLRGAHLDELGPRFTDMSEPYSKKLMSIAEQSSKELNIPLKKGVYGYWHGPTYETGAEINAFIALGADVVGMSTVAENMIAVNAGMNVLGISCITNMACIFKTGSINHEEVVEMGLQVSEKFMNLVTDIIKKI